MAERWAPMPDFEDFYEVSDSGRVRNKRTGALKAVRPNVTTGYPIVCFTISGKGYAKNVHRLVARAFVPGYAPGLHACHNDGTRDNNHYTNLRWDSVSGNMKDRIRHGTVPHRSGCPRGHEYAGKNLKTNRQGHRFCRACHRAHGRKGGFDPAVADEIYRELVGA